MENEQSIFVLMCLNSALAECVHIFITKQRRKVAHSPKSGDQASGVACARTISAQHTLMPIIVRRLYDAVDISILKIEALLLIFLV
jgi:hypothetical protein